MGALDRVDDLLRCKAPDNDLRIVVVVFHQQYATRAQDTALYALVRDHTAARGTLRMPVRSVRPPQRSAERQAASASRLCVTPPSARLHLPQKVLCTRWCLLMYLPVVLLRRGQPLGKSGCENRVCAGHSPLVFCMTKMFSLAAWAASIWASADSACGPSRRAALRSMKALSVGQLKPFAFRTVGLDLPSP